MPLKEPDKHFSSRRKVLGRGLSNLFPPSLEEEKPQKTSKGFFLGIERLQVNPGQPRRVFDRESLKELSDSIKQNGLIQPVIVKKSSGAKFEIVAGERRWRAAGLAGLHEIPVRILDQASDFLPLVENLQREDLNPVELATAYKKLMEEKELTQEKLAEKLGIARASLANHLRILKLPEQVRNLILEGRLSFALSKLLLQEKDPVSQIKWALYFAKHKTRLREAQKLMARQKPEKSTAPKNRWMQAVKNIQELYGVKSRIKFKNKGGELCLRFFSEKELDRLMDLLLKPEN